MTHAFANNGDFVVNALDNLLGSGDLIGIRSRATFQPPVHARAGPAPRGRGQVPCRPRTGCKKELQETEKKLGDLQARREDQNARS